MGREYWEQRLRDLCVELATRRKEWDAFGEKVPSSKSAPLRKAIRKIEAEIKEAEYRTK